MNAEAPRQVVGTKEFLTILENFNKKCQKGEKIPAKDVNEFYEIISSTQKKAGKKLSEATITNDLKITEQTISALKQLQVTLGQNKAVLESVMASIPYSEIKSALDTLDHYLNSQKKGSQRVSRKDSDQLPGHQ